MKKFSFLFLSVFLFFVSCSQNINEILSSLNTLILDYSDETQKPSMRLSVFVKTNGDVRHFKMLRLYSSQANYEWTVDNLVMVDKNNEMYAGYTNFIVPQGELIPQGEYEASFISYNDEENTTNFFLQYDQSLKDMSSVEAENYFKNNGSEEYVLIYNEEDRVLFFGKKTEKQQTENDIWLNYKTSKSYYTIWLKPDNSIMCIMPEKTIKRGETDE